MTTDFSNINLYFSEKMKLFIMRFKKQVTSDFLEPSLHILLAYKFISAHYEFTDTQKNEHPEPTLYSLTDRYFRYCVYRRNNFFNGKIWPIAISVISAIITSVITAYITANITLQSIP